MKAKILAAVAAGVLSVMSFSAAVAKDLNVGTHPVFAPFEYIDSQSGALMGFDIDMIREMAKRAGYTVQFQSMGFDALIPALLTGTIDTAVAGMTITEARKQKVDFCEPYYQAGQSLLVRQDSQNYYKDLASLKGRTIAVQIGTTGADFAKTVEGASIKSFNTSAEAFMDLKMKGADAVITDRPVISYFLVANPRASKGLVQQPIVLNDEWFGFPVKKGNKELLDKLNAALKAMKEDGTYQQLHKKWFGH